MMTEEQNDTLCRVGADTPMGRAMRRYWHPVALSEQLPHPDCNPLRVTLLGEKLVAFRDSEGRVGVMEELCMHRGASLAIGRVEDGGIRCIYHGWKFAVDGTILDTPNHSDCRFRQRLKAAAYPTREQSGLIWAYLGPAEHEPPFRRFAYDQDEHRMVFRVNVKVNYLQLWEGGCDSSHVGVLHSNQVRPSWKAERGLDDDPNMPVMLAMDDNAPRLEIEDTAFGYHYAAIRTTVGATVEDIQRNVRIVPIIMPSMRMIPTNEYIFTVFETPADDYNTSTFLVVHSSKPLNRDQILYDLGMNDARYWTPDNFDFAGSWDNGFFQDRAAMGRSWTGLHGIEIEDVAIGLSYGPLYDRAKEHLVPADQAVVRLRRRLMECVRLVEAGEPPLGAMIEDMTRVGAPDRIVEEGTRWQDLAPGHFDFVLTRSKA